MTPLDDTAPLRERLGAYTDPYLGQTLAEAKAISALTLQRNAVQIMLKFGFPCADYAAELKAALEAHLAALLNGARLELLLEAQITAHAVQRTLKPLDRVKNVSPWHPARAGSASRPSRPTSRSPGQRRGLGSGSWMRISTAPASRS